MNQSILTSIKKLLNIASTDTNFDMDIIIYINSVLAILADMGVGTKGFSITDSTAVWTDFLNRSDCAEIISYVGARVRILFDPPQNSRALEALEANAKEMEIRLYTRCSEEYNPYDEN